MWWRLKVGWDRYDFEDRVPVKPEVDKPEDDE